MPDPVAAIVALLDDHLTVPVYGGTFQGDPPGVLVRAVGGGSLVSGYMPTVDARLDVRVIHDTDWQASAVDREVARFLHMIKDTVTDHGRVRWCRLAGGPNQLRESQTGWPSMLTSWQVYGDWFA